MSYKRLDGRTALQMRPFTLEKDPFGYGDATILLSLGNTKVLCSVTLCDGVPSFLRNSNNGWLTAEYAMLPTATRDRTKREASAINRKGRNVEISRLIGRSLRSTIDLTGVGEKTIQVDCDVLQADGGTRTACITAASIALSCAIKKWNMNSMLKRRVVAERIAALSAGIVNDTVLVDLNQDEDNAAQADVNFVMTASGAIVEIQGTAEQAPFSWEQMVAIKEATATAMEALFTASL